MGEFHINSKGRPEGTSLTKAGVIHYTCNPPPSEVNTRLGIQEVGERFSIGQNEVLIIPTVLFKGDPVNTITTEILLRNVTSRERRR